MQKWVQKALANRAATHTVEDIAAILVEDSHTVEANSQVQATLAAQDTVLAQAMQEDLDMVLAPDLEELDPDMDQDMAPMVALAMQEVLVMVEDQAMLEALAMELVQDMVLAQVMLEGQAMELALAMEMMMAMLVST